MRPKSSSTNWFLAAGLAGLLVGGLIVLPGKFIKPWLVRDDAKLMSTEQITLMNEHHGYLLTDHDIDYRVMTRNRAGDIDQFAVRQFEELDVGGQSQTARGLLLVIDPAANLVRMEVGYSLEGVFPDAFIAYVEQRQMVPFFRAGRVADGILATTELIVTRIQNEKARTGFESETWFAGSGGAGAVTPARLDEGKLIYQPSGSGPPPGDSPSKTLAAYIEAMQNRDGSTDLAIYTPATRVMLKDWVVTPAQMDNVVRAYRTCQAEPVQYDAQRNFAVVRYSIEQRACSPYFFERIEGTWALDLTMMQRAIQFGRSNAWRFDLGAGHPYGFAFADWQFDGNGFPTRNE